MRGEFVQRKPIVVVGSVNTDLVAVSERIPSIGQTVLGTDFQVHPGGKGGNQAVAVARLGYPVHIIGRIGSDNFGTQLREHLESGGVDCGVLAVSPGPSGVAVILVSRAGENSIVVAPGANAKVTPNDIDQHVELLRGAGAVLAQLEVPLETVEYLARVCARENVPLILDPAPAAELPESLLHNTTWFTPNETEAAFYIGDTEGLAPDEMARRLRARGPRGVVLKLGSRGAYLSCDQADSFVPAFPVHAIDSTAAGDAFNGAFATGIMLGKSPAESAAFAAAAAAISVTRAGAQPSMPTLSEVATLLNTTTTGERSPAAALSTSLSGRTK